MNYEQGLAALQEIVQHRSPELLPDFSLLHFRLYDCLEREKKYGSSSDNNAERSRIVEELIRFTYDHFYLQFLDLCRSEEPTIVEKQPSSAILPSHELWTGDAAIIIQGDKYLLYEPVIIAWTPDQSALYQRAKAQQLGANRSVWLKQVQLYQATALSANWKTALEKESMLLDRLEQERRQDFPRRLAFEHNVHAATLVHTAVEGRSWAQTFGSSADPLDPYLTRLLLRSTIALCGMGPDLYRAPEQGLSNRSLAVPGASTDVYQLAMILYRFLTGEFPASHRQLLPLYSRNEAISSETDAVLQRALAFPVKERWRTIADFSSALRKTLS